MTWPIRPAAEGDRNYILKTWLKYIRSQPPFCYMSPRAYDKYSARVHGVVGACSTHVCHDVQDPTLIYGFITFDPIIKCVHMVNVRKDFRHHRIGTELVKSAFKSLNDHLRYSVWTDSISKYHLHMTWGLVEYDPFLLEGEV